METHAIAMVTLTIFLRGGGVLQTHLILNSVITVKSLGYSRDKYSALIGTQ
jgi:hypothetical protein